MTTARRLVQAMRGKAYDNFWRVHELDSKPSLSINPRHLPLRGLQFLADTSTHASTPSVGTEQLGAATICPHNCSWLYEWQWRYSIVTTRFTESRFSLFRFLGAALLPPST